MIFIKKSSTFFLNFSIFAWNLINMALHFLFLFFEIDDDSVQRIWWVLCWMDNQIYLFIFILFCFFDLLPLILQYFLLSILINTFLHLDWWYFTHKIRYFLIKLLYFFRVILNFCLLFFSLPKDAPVFLMPLFIIFFSRFQNLPIFVNFPLHLSYLIACTVNKSINSNNFKNKFFFQHLALHHLLT